MKKLLTTLSLLFISGWSYGLSTVYNPWTGKLDFIGSGSGGTPASPNYAVQFDSNGVFGGSANFTYNGSTLTLASVSSTTWTNVSSMTLSGVNLFLPSLANSTSLAADSNGKVVAGSGGGSVAVATGSVNGYGVPSVSTASAVVFSSNSFSTTLVANATAYVTWNSTTTKLQRTGSTTSSNSTTFVDTASTTTFTMKDPNHRLLLLAFGHMNATVTASSCLFTFMQDGSNILGSAGMVDCRIADAGNQFLPISLGTIVSPGNTDTHGYAVGLRSSIASTTCKWNPDDGATLIIQEIVGTNGY